VTDPRPADAATTPLPADGAPDGAALAEEVAGLRSEFATVLPHLVAALKRNDAVQELTDRLAAADKELAQRRALPALLGVARALHRVRTMDLPDDARITLDQELGQILADGGIQEFGEVGDPFDVALHDALDGSVGASGAATVSAVHATGLTMGALVVLRASVSIRPTSPEESQ
jgi:molecular chaperone GrpE (heat shock protein)